MHQNPNKRHHQQTKKDVHSESLSRGLSIKIELPCNKALDRLYIGGLESHEPINMALYNIRQVVNICDCSVGNEALVHKTEPHPMLNESIPVLQFFVGDLLNSRINLHLDSCAYFIHHGRTNERNVLVQCNRGISRSPVIVTAYIMCITGLPLIEILQALKVMRSVINLNKSFIRTLIEFQLYDAPKVWSNIQYSMGDWWKRGLDRSRMIRYARRFYAQGLDLPEMKEIERVMDDMARGK